MINVSSLDVLDIFALPLESLVSLRKQLVSLEDFDKVEIQRKACELWNYCIKFEIENRNVDKIFLSEIRYLSWKLFKISVDSVNQNLGQIFEISTKTAKSLRLCCSCSSVISFY
jgi:hypothetical protein